MSKRKATKTNIATPSANGRKIVRELMGLILLFFGLYLLLSLVTFDARDPGFNHAISTTKGVQNNAGIIGCYLGGLLTDIFGIAAYIWPTFFLLLAARQLFCTFSVQWWRCLGFICLLLCLMMAGTAWEFSIGDIKGGGFIGDALYGVSWKFLSDKGSFLLGLCFFLISIQLIFNISWLALLRAAWLWIVSCFANVASRHGDDGDGDDDPKPRQKRTQSQNATKLVPPVQPCQNHHEIQASPSRTLESTEQSPEKKGFLARIQQAFVQSEESSPSDSQVAENIGAEQGATANPLTLAEQGKDALAGESAPAEADCSIDKTLLQDPNTEGPNPFAAPWARACDIQAAWSSSTEQDTLLEAVDGATAPVVPTGATVPTEMPAPNMPAPNMPAPNDSDHSIEEGKKRLVGPNGGLIVQPSHEDALKNTQTQEDFLFDSLPVDVTLAVEENTPQDIVVTDNSSDVPADYEIELDATMAIQAHSPEQVSNEAPQALSEEGLESEECLDEIAGSAVEVISPANESIDEFFALDNGNNADAGDIEPSSADERFDDMHPQSSTSSTFEVLMDADKDGITDLTEEEVGTGGAAKAAPIKMKTSLPHLNLLQDISLDEHAKPRLDILTEKGERLTTCLSDFGIHGELTRITPGPVVTMFEFRPAPGVKVSRIANLSDDLALALKAIAVRIQAPIPGTDTVGIEIPNEQRETIYFKDLLASQTFHDASSLLTLAVGKDSAGRPSVADLAKMPHLLVAGATGAGKSVCLNSILLSFLYKARPEDVQLLLIDPKRIELAVYADLPHLVHPVVTDMSHAKNALDWAVHEMDRRYEGMARLGVRNIAGYNQKLESFGDTKPTEFLDLEFMPYLVIIIDELADLMLTAAKEVETSIVRLAQLARAAGIHMVLATQRPSVDVVTGIIKANFPCRISFQVTSKHDSRTILDTVGAEHLLGRGDMLFKPSGGRLQRLHGAFVSDDEVANVVEFWKRQQAPMYRVDFAEWGNEASQENLAGGAGALADDPVYNDAVEFVLTQGRASISLVQRRFRIGFNKAARYVEQMEQDGLIGPADGSKPRPVIKGREI
ncbi:MAG: DNA translocase FtsK [Pseudomonadota bacterium]